MNLGFTLLVFIILGVDWGIGFVVDDAPLLSLGWYQHNKIANALSSLGSGFDGMNEEIQGIREECEKICKTFNPHDQYMDEYVDLT